jgi:putative SOS response-associated peptidase YedK
MDKRCLIFVNGFYEWREVNKKKYPYYIQLKQQDTFAFGGIYDTWVNTETGELLSTCSIITTAANPLMEMIHNVKKRMPLIFDKDSMLDWIKPKLEQEEIRSLMKPFDENKMMAHTISKLISSKTDNPNVPEVKQEFLYPELNVLF